LTRWEQNTSYLFRALRLGTIRSKLLAFAVLATLIPSISMAWISYSQTKRSLNEKIGQELGSGSSQAARELDLWMKERLYDLRVFAGSYEVSENLARSEGTPRRLTDYLNSVRERSPDYDELMVLDGKGGVVATSAVRTHDVALPAGWQAAIRGDSPVFGTPYWDHTLGEAVMLIAVPIPQPSGRQIGALAARLNFRAPNGILQRFTPADSGRTLLVTSAGKVLISSRDSSADLMKTALSQSVMAGLLGGKRNAVEYQSYDGADVLGMLEAVPRVEWSVVTELPSVVAYRQVNHLRNVTILVVTLLLLAVGLIAYWLALLIVRPLDRLTNAAGEVAKGGLVVDLPVVGGGEVAYLTEVFNFMVDRLRDGRQQLDAIHETLRSKNEELERLSLTDGLTGLSNRRYLMERLASEVVRARRGRHSFAVVMADVDRFKDYNDSFGHLAGDEVLARVADILKETTREVDCVARYGGEEFLVMLPETGVDGAFEVAERVAARLAQEIFAGGRITLSMGVAAFPDFGETPEAVIMSADVALYQAKHGGRNQIVKATVRDSNEVAGLGEAPVA
jgi:diguanylate cyclase (GGDEF)-like protein